jgi:thymidylate synthase (FAD)
MKVVQESVKLMVYTEGAVQFIERAGRTCYQSKANGTQEGAETFVRGLIRRGHESVLEHASATFRIICDRGISHEIVRHRTASYSQESTRYVKYDAMEVVLPHALYDEKWKAQFGADFPAEIVSAYSVDFTKLNGGQAGWLLACLNAELGYRAMLAGGCAPEMARSVLPTCLKTELVMTANFREWRHFLKMRGTKYAHPQVRAIAEIIKRCFAVIGCECIVDDINIYHQPKCEVKP